MAAFATLSWRWSLSFLAQALPVALMIAATWVPTTPMKGSTEGE
jgi:hypothetical protein